MMNSTRFTTSAKLIRSYSSAPSEFVNRNPRNLERMCIARKPDGYHIDKPGRKFWHKLYLNESQRKVTVQVVHFINGPVVEVKSTEWAIRKQIYSLKDTSAYINLGRVFAQRCLEAGLTEVFCDIQPVAGGKVEKFLKEVENGGVKLSEPERYVHPYPWSKDRPAKPWEFTED